MKRIALCFTVLLAMAVAIIIFSNFSQALPSSGSLYISIPNASIKCANIVLPDDGGYFGRGAVDYIITMTPDPYETWSDLSYQRVTTNENNTAIIPVCFSSFNRNLGTCAEPFTIRISAPSAGIDKSWEGGACASEYPDFDTGSLDGGEDDSGSAEGLDDNDLFSIGFEDSSKYAKPGEHVEFNLWVQSYAELELDFSVQGYGGISVTPSTASASTGPGSSFRELNFTAGPMAAEKTYSFTVTATAQDCGSGSLCTRKASAELLVGQQQPELTGFKANIFPGNMNVKNLLPVTYRLTINNMAESGEFSLGADLPEGLETTFAPATITVPSGDYRTLTFTVTPSDQSSSYELDFTVRNSAGVTKPVTAYLSTNELLTDVQRSVEQINQLGDSQASAQAEQESERWYRSYQGSGYGEGLDDYSGLQSSLQAARQPGQDKQTSDNGDAYDDNQDDGPDSSADGLDILGKDAWMLLVALLAVLGVLFYFFKFRKGKKAGGLDQEIDLEEGF